ncbi:MAG TPA: prepilin-type N-terminal cleavage/methylation domain-containing protein [Rhizomicrobium sp.]|jgi:general secretion pathway protein J
MTRNCESGFTLVELLVSITLMAFLSLLLFGGLHFGTRVWQKATSADTVGNKILLAQASLASTLRQAYPFFVLVSPTDRHVQFDGEAQSMTFFAPAERGGLDVVTIAHDPNGTLVMNSRPELATHPAADVTHRVLLSGVKSFSAAYFGAMNKGAPQQWYPVWRNAHTLPDLIRLRADLDDKSAKWPDLLVAPQVSADQACVYDQLTKYCTGRL